jgi:hypothetical protein
MKPPGWDDGILNSSTAPDKGECVVCGNEARICCGDFEEAPDGLQEYVDATCVDCCGPHFNQMSGVGYYERMDCDV